VLRIHLRVATLAVAVGVAAMMAGASSARPYLERGDLARLHAQPASSARTEGGGQGQAASGQPGSNVDPGASAKKGAGYCARESDGDVIKCPSAPKKPAKKGNGFVAG
jgi:hypothetical protein